MAGTVTVQTDRQILEAVGSATAADPRRQPVAAQVAASALGAVPAEHCAVYVLDTGSTTLRPAWVTARRPGPALDDVCSALPAVDSAAGPARLRFLRAGRVVPVADLAKSSLAPPELVERLGTRAALLAPLVAEGDPVGLLVLGWPALGRVFSPDERDVLAAVAALAATAVAGTQAPSAIPSSVSLRRVAAAGAAFADATTVAEVLDRLDDALADLLDVHLIGVEVALGDPATDAAARAWRRAEAPPGRPRRRADLALPVTSGDRHLGSVAVAVPTGRALHGQEIDACAALVSFGAAALARVLSEHRMRARLQEAEALRRLSDVVAGTGGLLPAMEEMNRRLPPELGLTLRSLSVANVALRASVGGEAPDGAELEAIRSWRAVLARGRSPLRPRRDGSAVLVPVVHGNRVLGALRVHAGAEQGPSEDAVTVDELLLAVGAGLAEVVRRAGLQREVAESERRLAVAAERERIAHDLHDSVGQIITGMGMRLAQCLADAPDRTWRARLEELLRMAGRGNREIRQAIHELLFLDARRDGLVASVRELVRTFEVTTGLPVHFVVQGTPAPLVATREDALFRAAHEALVNVERHARASMATVELAYGADTVSLVVSDDGVGLGHRDPFGADGGHFGIRAMQQRLMDAGGELRVGNSQPRGVVVEAVITRARRTARGTGTSRRRR